MPQYETRSLADKSSHKYIEHLMWELVAKDELEGPDLYSTLWYTIARVLEPAASACRLDNEVKQQDNHDFNDNEHLYHDSDRAHDPDNDHHAKPPVQAPKHSIKCMLR